MSVIDETWAFKIDIKQLDKQLFSEFKADDPNLSKQITNQLHGFQTQTLNYSGSLAKNSDDELRMITEKNKQLVHNIKSKVEEYEQQQEKYNKFKSEQKILATEIKDTHEAFLMAKKYYKKFLKIYFTIESRTDGKDGIFLQFFTEAKKESKGNSVYLLRDSKTKHYEVLQITPGQEICKEVQQKLQVTNDVPGALCYIRHHFMKMKKGKKGDS
ncbi:uncharacterized protein LOC125233150 [Leguminivora glycinivorella]|uniref:uncharacterized protein LOC125233150 n=1 Tax=Leguminivora glycinivorella TaxID=1035111 RepID=UPI00200EC163|nr:uncharacterized protein LOC125233150 [Leguminivora glycinivorella]